MSRLILCVAAMNEADMLPYSIGSVYDEVDKILVVEGAVAGRFDTPHSTDDTIEVIESLNKDGKIQLIQKDGYWDTLEEQKSQFTKYMEAGDWYVICDADEVYMEGQLTKLKRIMKGRPQYNDYIPIFLEFYGDLKHIMRPKPGYVNLTNQRIVKHRPGAHWSCHHPTMCDARHIDTCCDPRYEGERIVIPDMNIFHLSWIRDRDFMIEKHSYYFRKFDGNPPNVARKRAIEKVDKAGEDLLEYTGRLPKILEGHPIYGKTIIDRKVPDWKDVVEYRKPETIPIVYNTLYIPLPKASVVIACYKNKDLLDKVLDAWGKQTYHDYEVICVDDGSPKEMDLKSIVESHGFIYRYNDTGDVYSIGSARNLGIWAASGDRVIFTDADMIPDKNFIMEHMINGNPRSITVGPRYRWANINNESIPNVLDVILSDDRPDDFIWDDDRIHFSTDEYTCDIDIIPDPRLTNEFPKISAGRCFDPWESVHGCNFSVSRNALIKINGFDEDYDGKWGAEDIDLAYRLIRLGYKVTPVPLSIGYHIDHPSREREGQRALLNKKMNEDPIRKRPKSWV